MLLTTRLTKLILLFLERKCRDLDLGALDVGEFGCAAYRASWCGQYDDSDFKAHEMCCVCGGGLTPEIGNFESTIRSLIIN